MSFKNHYSAQPYRVQLTDCAYYVDPGGDLHVVGRAEQTPADNTGTITQLLHVHMFWKPHPGKTFDNPSGADATLRYLIITDRGTAAYCGTGFVYPSRRRMSDQMIARIENARLRLESQTGDPPELIGRGYLKGTLLARNDPGLAVDLRRRLELQAAGAGSH